MATTTIRELIESSGRLINIVQDGQPMSASEMEVALYALRALEDSWSNNSLMIYSFSPTNFSLVGGQKDYTLGPGGDWDIERPMNIQQAYVHYQATGSSQIVDLPIALLNDAQYAAIAVKNTPSTFPTALYDNGNYPLRTISFFPVPNQSQQVTLWLWQPLASFTNINEPFSFPPGYLRAFRFALAVELAAEFGKDVPPVVSETAIKAVAELKNLNSVPQIMTCPSGMQSSGRTWNWITSQDSIGGYPAMGS
jgi:hypothetical protein